MMRKRFGNILVMFLSVMLFSYVAAGFAAFAADGGPVTVFAAASTTNAITDIAKLFEGRFRTKVTPSFASSSTLAKQIEQGAPADVFLSADLKWMDYLAGKNMIEPQSRFNLLGNTMVLIAPAATNLKIDIGPGFDLAKVLGDGRLAMGDPSHVPVGTYGKQALQKLGIWPTVEQKVAAAKDVRAALALVERGEAPLGLVYATDAAISKKVKVVGVFPTDTHPPIVYPVALVKDRVSQVAKDFLKFLNSTEAKGIFEQYGFSVHK